MHGACVLHLVNPVKAPIKKLTKSKTLKELAEPQVEAPVEVTPVVAAPVTTPKATDTTGVRQEKGDSRFRYRRIEGLQRSSRQLRCEANAEGLKDWLDGQGLTQQSHSMRKKQCTV